MKICIPTQSNKGFNDTVNDHFGSSAYFTIINTDNNTVEIIENNNAHENHGTCFPLQSLSNKGINLFICKGMGKRAVLMMNSENIQVYFADNTSNVKDLVDTYKKGLLKPISIEDACGGHDCH